MSQNREHRVADSSAAARAAAYVEVGGDVLADSEEVDAYLLRPDAFGDHVDVGGPGGA